MYGLCAYPVKLYPIHLKAVCYVCPPKGACSMLYHGWSTAASSRKNRYRSYRPSHNTDGRSSVAERNTETAALIIDRTVKGDLSLRAQAEQQCRIHLQCMDMLGATAAMNFLRRTGGGLVVGTTLLAAPVQRGPIPICDVPEHTANQKAFLDEPYQSFHLALDKGMPGLAELRLEAY